MGAAEYAESTEVGDETRYVTDARARYGSARWGDWVEERFRTFRLATPGERSPFVIPLGRLILMPTPPPTSGFLSGSKKTATVARFAENRVEGTHPLPRAACATPQ